MLGLGFGLVWLGIRCSLSILELMPGAIWCETLLEHYVHLPAVFYSQVLLVQHNNLPYVLNKCVNQGSKYVKLLHCNSALSVYSSMYLEFPIVSVSSL